MSVHAASTEPAGPRPRWPLAAAALFFGGSYLALRDASVMLPLQGQQYVCTAQSLATGGGFAVTPGGPLVNFAPLYALLLAPFALAGHAVVPAVYLLNCLALAAGLLGFYWLAREAKLPFAGVAAAAFALWPVHYYMLRTGSPDGLAVALTLLTLAALMRYGRLQGLGALVPVVAFAGLAASCRYMTALTLLPVLAAGVAALTAGAPKKRLLRGAAVAALAGAPIAAWVARNLTLTGHMFGMSRTSARPLAEGSDLPTNLARLAKTLVVDLFATDALGTFSVIAGELSPSHRSWILVGASVALAAAAFAAARCRRERLASVLGRRERVGLALYPAFYLVMLVTLWTVGNNDPIHTRYVAPLYPFLGLGGLALASCLRTDRAACLALALAAALVLVPGGVKSVRLLGQRPDDRLLELHSRTKQERWHSELSWRSPECLRVLPRAMRPAPEL